MKQHKKQDEFMRKLSTNYKYSGLVTLTMRFAKSKNFYGVTKDMCTKLEIKEQKNYSVIALRLALLLKEFP